MVKFKEYDIVSNFYPSQYKNLNEVPLNYYQKGRKTIEKYRDTSINYCVSLLDSLHQETTWGGGTLYSTLYDLNEGIVYLYYFHNYNHVVKFDLKKELEKGNHILTIPEVFPKNKVGLRFYKAYNETLHNIELLGDKNIIEDTLKFSTLKDSLRVTLKINIFREKIDEVCNRWLNTKEYKNTISVYSFLAELFPDDVEIYSNLGETYMEIGAYNSVLESYEKLLKIEPNNEGTKTQIKKLKELMKKK